MRHKSKDEVEQLPVLLAQLEPHRLAAQQIRLQLRARRPCARAHLLRLQDLPRCLSEVLELSRERARQAAKAADNATDRSALFRWSIATLWALCDPGDSISDEEESIEHAVSEEERARHAAVERSRVEAAEARAAARQARERRETLASAASFGGSGSSLDAEVPPPRAFSSADRAPSPPKAPIPPAFAHGDFADFTQFDTAKPSGFEGFPPEPSGAEPSRAPGRASPPAPAPIPPPPGDGSAAAAADLSEPHPHPPSGPVSTNTAHETARAQMLRACAGLLPSPHAPREGLTEHQKKLGPPPGDFCRPRFCSRACVAASCAGFIQACGGAASAGLVSADASALTKALKKIAIRNHPDRHSAQRVGVEKAASATVLTQQVSFLQSMLEDFEYVPARVAVSSGGAEPGTQANETVVLPRVHLGATTAQLRDGVIEERPELAAKRDSLGLALRSAPGAAETTVAIGATTLRELGVTKDSTFRMWTWTAAEKSWEAGFL